VIVVSRGKMLVGKVLSLFAVKFNYLSQKKSCQSVVVGEFSLEVIPDF
jgi:hypothetical protein